MYIYKHEQNKEHENLSKKPFFVYCCHNTCTLV